jgi:hypothetical protein
MAVNLRTESIQTTIYALNNDFAGRRNDPNFDEKKSIHIHRRNRAYVWKKDNQERFKDSILKGYYINPIICSSYIVDGIERREVMDGGNRITTISRILKGEVGPLTEQERNIINSYTITLVVMRGLTNFQQREMFCRLNKNIKVTDGQLYEMSDDSPLVVEAINLLNNPNYPLRSRLIATFTDAYNKDNDGKTNLENAVAIVSGALNGVEYITKSFSRQEHLIESMDPIDRMKVVTTIGNILDIFDAVEKIIPLTSKPKKKVQWTIGKFIGAILYDIIVYNDNIQEIKKKWIKYFVKSRNFVSNADDAIKIGSAQNLTPDKLKRISYKVQIFIDEERLVSDEDIKKIKHNSEQEYDSDSEENDEANAD